MGKISILTKEQKSILDEIKNNKFLSTNFYFTGGTALSYFYLKHRYSEDLEFFCDTQIDTRAILEIVEGWSKKYKFKIKAEFIEVVYRFELAFPGGYNLKLDFGQYPYRNIEKRRNIEGVLVDSLRDIAVNKLLTIVQRGDVKDFVDMYFLLQKYTFWDLMEGVRFKFKINNEPYIYASDFLKVDNFKVLPKMIKKLDLDTLKVFFREKAKILGGKAVI